MPDTLTTRYGFVQPEVGASSDTWGAKLNSDLSDLDAVLGVVATAGAANAYTLTTGLALTAYVDGQSWLIRASFGNTGGATLAVDGLVAKNLRKVVGGVLTALASGDISTNDYLRVAYNSASDVIVVMGLAQPLDATLTALAALAWTTGAPLVQFTAADTISLTLTPSVTSYTAAIGSATAAAFAFAGDPDTGMFSTGANNLELTTGGTARLNLSSTRVSFAGTGQVRLPDGVLASPGLAFGNETGTGFYRIGANNWAGATGGTKFVDIASALIDFSVPVRARVPASTETTGTLTAASANRKIVATGGITLPASVFVAEDAIVIDGGGTARTITRGAGLTMYINGVDSATGTLTANGIMGVHYRSATVCILTGNIS
jgi:hypothetical protein